MTDKPNTYAIIHNRPRRAIILNRGRRRSRVIAKMPLLGGEIFMVSNQDLLEGEKAREWEDFAR